MKKLFLLLILSLCIFACWRPYEEKKYQEILPNQSAFVVPLEGSSEASQGKFNSIDFLEKQKVATQLLEK